LILKALAASSGVRSSLTDLVVGFAVSMPMESAVPSLGRCLLDNDAQLEALGLGDVLVADALLLEIGEAWS
jgi:hypothetical protein